MLHCARALSASWGRNTSGATCAFGKPQAMAARGGRHVPRCNDVPPASSGPRPRVRTCMPKRQPTHMRVPAPNGMKAYGLTGAPSAAPVAPGRKRSGRKAFRASGADEGRASGKEVCNRLAKLLQFVIDN